VASLLILLLAAAPASSAAGELQAVTPLGASAGVTVKLAVTGVDPVVANNDIILRPVGGEESRVQPSSISVLDSPRDLWWVSFVVPPGLAIGPASVSVLNRTTGVTSTTRTLQIIAIGLSPSAIARGQVGVPLRIIGSPNAQFTAGRTVVRVDAGVTVTSVTVESLTSILVEVAVGSGATLGPRSVSVVSSLHQAVLAGALTVTSEPPPPTNHAPVAHAGGPYAPVEVGRPLFIDGRGSSDEDGDALLYAWSFGDGATSTAPAPQHGYVSAGTYTVTLTVTDPLGASDSDTATVTVVPPVDRSPPSLSLAAPSLAVPGSTVPIVATAADEVGVAAVRFSVDGVPVAEVGAPPYVYSLSIPAVAAPGRTFVVRVTARDAQGNETSAEAVITVSTEPDTTPPTVGLAGPPNTSPGSAVRLVAQAQDEVGVKEVVFLAGGLELGRDAAAPFEASCLVPKDTAVGVMLRFTARAIDFSGNVGEAVLDVPVIGVADTTAPMVALTAPAEALPGERVTLSVLATDTSGISSVAILANDRLFTTLLAQPYETSWLVPADTVPGSAVTLEARATDFAGNQASDRKTLQVVAPSLETRAVLVGEVYDDTTGLPLAGARVVLVGTDMQGRQYDVQAATDATGAYLLRGWGGQGVVRIARDAWTSVTRPVTLVAGRAVEVFDARLTPLLVPAGNVAGALGGRLAAGRAELLIPPGLTGDSSGLRLAEVSGQGLAGPLPPGWSPVGVVDVAPHDAAWAAGVMLRLTHGLDPTALGAIVVARWDATATGWRVLGPGRLSTDLVKLEAEVSAAGQYVWLVADLQPIAPPAAVPGQLIAGVAVPSVPEDLAAQIVPEPRVLFYQPGVTSVVRGTVVAATAPITSGLRLWARLREHYRFLSGDEMSPEPRVQDLVFYQVPGSASTLAATHVVSPTQQFDALAFDEGVIAVELLVPPAVPSPPGMAGPDGGTITGQGGEALAVAPGSLTDATPISLASLVPGDLGLTLPAGFDVLSGVQVALGRDLLAPAVLSLAKPAGVTDASRLLFVRVAEVAGRTRLVLVAVVSIAGDRVLAELSVGGLATALGGVRSSGRYLLVSVPARPGFADGVVRGVGGLLFEGALVSVGEYAVVSLSNGIGGYTAAGAPGTATVAALDTATRDTASATTTLAAGTLKRVDLRLVADGPRVVSTRPADGALNVALSDPVVVTFSEPIDPATIAGINIERVALVPQGGTRIDGIASLSNSNTVLTFRPSAPLAADTHFTFTLAREITDISGYSLPGAVSFSFDSLDTSPPPAPAAGSITADLPSATGTTTVSATQGTAGPRDTVWIRNRTTGVVTPAPVEANGSFSAIVAAALTDELEVVITDLAGNETVVEVPRFRRQNPDGSVSVGLTSEGGAVEGPGGVRADVKPGTFPDGAVVTLKAIEAADFPVQLGPEHAAAFTIDRGISVDFGGATPQQYVDLSIPPVGGETDDTRWVVVRAMDFDGQPFLNAVDTAKFRGGRITTASPPCPGVTAAGAYGFVRSQQAVGINYASTYTGFGSGLMIGLKYFAAGTSYLLPYGVFADRFADLLCYPVLTGSVTLTPNTTQVVVPGMTLTPADRQLRFISRTVPSLPAVTLGRDVLEFVYDVKGTESDSYRILARGVAPDLPDRPRSQLLTRATISPLSATTVRVRIDPDPITIVLDDIVITNLTRGEENSFVAASPQFRASVPGGNGDEYEVTVIDVMGRQRTLPGTLRGADSANGEGNLVLRALRGAIDPTREEMDKLGLSGPARTRLYVTAKRSGLVRVVPNDRVVEGGTTFAFDGALDDDFTLTVEYDLRGPYTIELPRVQLIVKNPVTGRVLRTVDAFAPPFDLPQNLGVVSDDTVPPYVIAGPTRLSRFDPAGQLTFTFSEAMNEDSLKRAFVVTDSKGNRVAGSVQVSVDGRMARFVPAGGLKLGEKYTVEIRGYTAAGPGSSPSFGATDRAGNLMPALKLTLRMFVPRQLGTWNSAPMPGQEAGETTSFAPFKDIAIPKRTVGGPSPSTLFVTTGAPTFNLVAVNTNAPAKMGLVMAGEGPISRQRVLVLPRVAFKKRTGEDFAGDIVITSTFNVNASRLDFYDVTHRGLADEFRPLGFKILTENPDLTSTANRYNTILADGLVKGIAAVTTAAGITVYAAVERVGVMSADLGQNTPGRDVTLRLKEGLYPGDFTDLQELKGNVFAISRAQRRLDVIGSGLATVGYLPLPRTPRRVRVVSDFTFDENNDGQIAPDERRDLAYVAADNALLIVDVTDPAHPTQVGSVELPGTVRDVDVDLERRRAFAIIDTGGEVLLSMIDVTNPTLNGLLDDDRDGLDDRLIWKYPHSGANGLRLDAGRGVLFVAGIAGLEAWAAYDLCCDTGVDLVAPPTTDTSGEFAVLLRREKRAIQQGIAAGLDQAAARCGLIRDDLVMLESGSGACVWDLDPSRTCGTSYRPGLSDHDISVFFLPRAFLQPAGDGTVDSTASCTIRRLSEQFIDPVTEDPKPITIDGVDMKFEEISFLVNFMMPLYAARYPLNRTDPDLPGDPTNDMALGRQVLLLRHLLEGRWVTGITGWGSMAGRPLEDLLTLLRTETGIPRVNGYEAARLQEFALAKGKVYVRMRGSSKETSSLNEFYVKQVHGAAKAAIRSVIGRLVVHPEARERLLAVRRDKTGPPGTPDKPNLIYNENACVIIDPGISPELWQHGPCGSLEEFIASMAARTLRWWGTQPPLDLFTRDQVVNQIARFYRVKVDLETIDTEQEADEFIAQAHKFVQWVLLKTQPSYDVDIPTDPDRAVRADNLAFAQQKLLEAQTQAKLKLDPHVFNRGFALGDGLKVAMYTYAGSASYGQPAAETGVTLEPASEQFLKYQRTPTGELVKDFKGKAVPAFEWGPIDQTGDPGVVGAVAFTIDVPQRTMKEAERQNNVGGFNYYVLDVDNPGPPPGSEGPIRLPVAESALDPDPDCDGDPSLTIQQTLHLLAGPFGPAEPKTLNSPATVLQNQNAKHEILVRNGSPNTIEDITLCDTLSGTCRSIGTLSAGAEHVTIVPVPTTAAGVIDVVPTVYSEYTGIQRGSPFRIVVSCERYQLTALGPDEKATVMRGGTAMRYFRVIDRLDGVPLQGATITVKVEGTNARTQTYTTDAFGYVGQDTATGFLRGVRIGYPPALKTGTARATVSLDLGAGSTCTATAQSFDLEFAPFESSHTMKAGAAIEGAGIKVLTFKLGVGAAAGLSLGLARKDGDDGEQVYSTLSIGRSALAKASFGLEADLFKGKVSGGGQLMVQGPTGKVAATVDGTVGDSFEFADVRNLTKDDKLAIAGFVFDTAARAATPTPLMQFVVDQIRRGLHVKSPRTGWSAGVTFGANLDVDVFKVAVGFNQEHDATQQRRQGAIGADFTIGGGLSGNWGLGVSRSFKEKTMGVSFSVSGGLGMQAGLEAGARKATQKVDEKPASAEKKGDEKKTIADLTQKTTVGLSGSANGGISLGITTPDYLDLSDLPAGTDLWPSKIDIGYSSDHTWGFKSTQPGVPGVDGAPASATQNQGGGQTFSFGYSVTSKDLIKAVARDLSLFNSFLFPEQRQQATPGAPSPQIVISSQGSIFEQFGEFLVNLLPDGRYTRSVEKGTGVDFPIGFDVSALGEGVSLTINPIKFNQSVSYTLMKGAIKDGQAFDLEDYSGVSLEPAGFDAITQILQEVSGDAVRGKVRKGIHRPAPTATPEEENLLFGPAPQPNPETDAAVFNPGEVELHLASNADLDRVQNLLSFDFTPIAGPLAPAPYEPIATSGAADKPHYGVGGFHHFELPGTRLVDPARLSVFYDDAEVAGQNEAELRIYEWSEQEADWMLVGGTVDASTNVVTAQVSRLGVYTLAPPMPAGPITWTVTNVSRITGSDPASSKTIVRLRSNPVRRNDATPVAAGTLIHVVSAAPGQSGESGAVPFGAILTADASPVLDGVQVALAPDGVMEIEVELPGTPDVMEILAFSDIGTAYGQRRIAVSLP
jgi:PKD repeat protein